MNCCFQIFQTFLVLDQISRGENARFPALWTPMVTYSLVLLFTHHKNAWLAAIASQSLSCCIICHDVCVQQQCCHRLLYKITRFTKKFTRSETNSLNLKIFVEVCSFAWNDLVIYFITTKPLHHLQVCWNRSCWSLKNALPTIIRSWKRHHTRIILDQSA